MNENARMIAECLWPHQDSGPLVGCGSLARLEMMRDYSIR